MYNSLKRFCSEVLSAVSVRWARNGLVPLLLLRLGPTSFETRASAFDLQQLPPQYLLMLRRNRKFLSARTISALVASAELPPLIIVLRTVLNCISLFGLGHDISWWPLLLGLSHGNLGSKPSKGREGEGGHQRWLTSFKTAAVSLEQTGAGGLARRYVLSPFSAKTTFWIYIPPLHPFADQNLLKDFCCNHCD